MTYIILLHGHYPLRFIDRTLGVATETVERDKATTFASEQEACNKARDAGYAANMFTVEPLSEPLTKEKLL